MTRQPFNPALIRADEPPPPAPPSGVLTVSMVTAMVKRALETSLPPTMHVVGQISNFKRHSSGHLYFTLKDDGSELGCVMWRSMAAKVKFTPTDGLEVVATGHVEVFERAGRYQLYVRKLEPRGTGALELAFRQLREKLEQEGLFDPGRKKPIPSHPACIGVVTSPTGAAIRDILQTLRRRHPGVRVILAPVRVQGPTAAAEIAEAIRRFNRCGEALGVDLLIVGRGGGSLEDLWAFNEEAVARAIHDSSLPIISAVGHEVDVTIADMVADLRAATPTAAAELAVPVLAELLERIDSHRLRLRRCLRHHFEIARSRVDGFRRRRAFGDPLLLVRHRAQSLDELNYRLTRLVQSRFRRVRQQIERSNEALACIAPHEYLRRMTFRLSEARHRLHWAAGKALNARERRLNHRAERMTEASPRFALSMASQKLERTTARLRVELRHGLTLRRRRLEGSAELLAALDHRRTLARGFSITRKKKGRGIVRSQSDVLDGDRVLTETADGTFESTVVNQNQMELFE